MSAQRARGYLRPCGVKGCDQRIPGKHVACDEHWAMVPVWLQRKLKQQMHYGLAWKCHPTQEYLDLRSQAIQLVNAASAEKYAKPAPSPQLPLLPST